MIQRYRVLAIAAVVGLLGIAHPAWAGPPADQLQVQVNRVLKILQDPELKKENRIRDRRTAIRQVANDIFDFTEITRRSLGRHWQARTPQLSRPRTRTGPAGPSLRSPAPHPDLSPTREGARSRTPRPRRGRGQGEGGLSSR